MSVPQEQPSIERSAGQLAIRPEIFELRPWYHDFSRLGLRTRFDERERGWMRPAVRLLGAVLSRLRPNQLQKGERLLSRANFSCKPSSHFANQPIKEAVLAPLIDQALTGSTEQSCLDLFCADGYYSCMMAKAQPAARVTGVDLDPNEIRRARAAARALGFDQIEFLEHDVHRFVEATNEAYSFVLCAGGLYHLGQPRKLLRRLSKIVDGFLLVQSVVSLRHEEPDYFESPAPGWRHGCRFSHARLRSWLLEDGWSITSEQRNELTGNRRKEDRGSSYFLCRSQGVESCS